jgi:hypothetical protein
MEARSPETARCSWPYQFITSPDARVDSTFELALNQVTPDSTIGGEKTKLPLKSGVIESSQAITTDMQKGVSSEQVEDTEARSQRTPASVKDYTKEARRKQATHR